LSRLTDPSSTARVHSAHPMRYHAVKAPRSGTGVVPPASLRQGVDRIMAPLSENKVPPAAQPHPGDYGFDLGRGLEPGVGVHSLVPADAFTAETLGTERAGNGVVIDKGLVLTIGYLIMEAETVWIHRNDGGAVEGHVLGFDYESGFGLVQALGRLDLTPLAL